MAVVNEKPQAFIIKVCAKQVEKPTNFSLDPFLNYSAFISCYTQVFYHSLSLSRSLLLSLSLPLKNANLGDQKIPKNCRKIFTDLWVPVVARLLRLANYSFFFILQCAYGWPTYMTRQCIELCKMRTHSRPLGREYKRPLSSICIAFTIYNFA